MWFDSWCWCCLPLPSTEKILHTFDHVIPVKLASDCKENIIRLIMSLPEVLEVHALDTGDTLAGAQYQAAKRRTFVEVSAYQLKDAAHRLVVAAANFLLDKIAHLLQLVIRKG